MKKSIQAVLAAALLLGANAASAQITFGPKVGLNLSSVKYELSDSAKVFGLKDDDVKMKTGASLWWWISSFPSIRSLPPSGSPGKYS